MDIWSVSNKLTMLTMLAGVVFRDRLNVSTEDEIFIKSLPKLMYLPALMFNSHLDLPF